MEEEQRSLTTLDYTISVEEYEKSYFDFQKRYLYPKYIVMTAALVIVIIMYIDALFHDHTYKFGWGVIGICLACIAAIWGNMHRMKKIIMNSVREMNGDKYKTDVYEDRIVIQTEVEQDEKEEPIEIPPKIISYIYDRPKIVEIKEMFIIYLKNQLYYVIPKSDLNEEQINILIKTFQEKFEDGFKKLKAK